MCKRARVASGSSRRAVQKGWELAGRMPLEGMRVASLVTEVAGEEEWETRALEDGNAGSGLEKGMRGQGTRARRQDGS